MFNIENQNSNMVENALRALLGTYAKGKDIEPIFSKLHFVISNHGEDFVGRVNGVDEILASNAEFSELSEVVFDLLMVSFLAFEQHDEDFFESPEWTVIEDKFIDRGTELLNLYLYISEANQTEVEITLEDFVNEFLLADSDEFQDEFKIYEELIVNSNIIDADLCEIRKIESKLNEDSLLYGIFVPIVLYFSDPYREDEELVDIKLLSAFEQSILESLYAVGESES